MLSCIQILAQHRYLDNVIIRNKRMVRKIVNVSLPCLMEGSTKVNGKIIKEMAMEL